MNKEKEEKLVQLKTKYDSKLRHMSQYEFDYVRLYSLFYYDLKSCLSLLEENLKNVKIVELQTENTYKNLLKAHESDNSKIFYFVHPTTQKTYYYILLPGKIAMTATYNPIFFSKQFSIAANSITRFDIKVAIRDMNDEDLDEKMYGFEAVRSFVAQQREVEKNRKKPRNIVLMESDDGITVGIGDRKLDGYYLRFVIRKKVAYIELELKNAGLKKLNSYYQSNNESFFRYFAYQTYNRQIQTLVYTDTTKQILDIVQYGEDSLLRMSEVFEPEKFKRYLKKEQKLIDEADSRALLPVYKKKSLFLFSETPFESCLELAENSIIILLGVYSLYFKKNLNTKPYKQYKRLILTLNNSTDENDNQLNELEFGKLTFTFKELMNILGLQHRSENFKKTAATLLKLQKTTFDEIYENETSTYAWMRSSLFPSIQIEKKNMVGYQITLTINRSIFFKIFDEYTVLPVDFMKKYFVFTRLKQKKGKLPVYFYRLCLKFCRALRESFNSIELQNLCYFPKSWKQRETFYYYVHNILEFFIKENYIEDFSLSNPRELRKTITLTEFKKELKGLKQTKIIYLHTIKNTIKNREIMDIEAETTGSYEIELS